MRIFKKLLLTSVAVLGLASVGALGSNQANASSYMGGYEREATYTRRSYVRKPIKLERLSHSSVFATIRATGHAWLHKNERVGVVEFNHMGRDGYIVHIPGRSGIYYAPTNSHSWFGKKIVKRHHESKRIREINKAWAHAPKYLKGHFVRTNNKRLLRKSGFEYKVPDDHEYPTIVSNYLPNSHKAYIPKHLKLRVARPYSTGWMSGLLGYGYIGHNTWKSM